MIELAFLQGRDKLNYGALADPDMTRGPQLSGAPRLAGAHALK